MPTWSLEEIEWNKFDASKVKPELLSIVKAAAVVEYNSHDYSRYLCEVFSDDLEFQQVAKIWADEEIQHGKALRKWAELADPEFNFDERVKIFTEGYSLPKNVTESVRGSRSGELVARCIVETGTSWYYGAIKDYTDEPVLKQICSKISSDELRHFKLFYNYFNIYQKKEPLSFFKRLSIAIGRVLESEDDELAYAFYATDTKQASSVYNRKTYTNNYFNCVGAIYKRIHIERMTAMVFKVVGLKPHGLLNRGINVLAWNLLKLRVA